MEVQPLEAVEYKKLIKDGLHGIFVYQETYNTESYAKHHLKGRKKNFNWRLETPERLGSVGINKIGLGCLYGLTKDWRTDAYFAAQHLGFLKRNFGEHPFSPCLFLVYGHVWVNPSQFSSARPRSCSVDLCV